MTSGGETPGIGAPGIPRPKQRASKAWHRFAQQATVQLPRDLAKARSLRRRLRRIGLR